MRYASNLNRLLDMIIDCSTYLIFKNSLTHYVAAIPGRASLRSVGRQELDVPRTRLVSSERAFEVAAPKQSCL